MDFYRKKAEKLGELVDKKQIQYGNSFKETHKILKILYPNEMKSEQYHDALAIVRIVDKLFRISKGNQGDESAWDDIAGYAILMAEDK